MTNPIFRSAWLALSSSALVPFAAQAAEEKPKTVDVPASETETAPDESPVAVPAPVVERTDDAWFEQGAPRPLGRVIEVHEGRVVVERPPGEALARGARVAFLDARGDEVVVGEIDRVNRATYWVVIRMNETVRVGESAHATRSELSGSLVAPRAGAYDVAIGASVKPWLGLSGDTSGFLFEGFGTFRVSDRVRARVAIEPFSPPIGDRTPDPDGVTRMTPGSLEAYGALSAHFHLMEVGFGVGAGTTNERYDGPPGVGLLLTPLLRVGAEDGLVFRVRSSAVVVERPEFGSFRAELGVPVAYGLQIVHAGGGGSSGYYFLEIGAKKSMTGNGGPGTWFASVAIGHGGTFEYDPARGRIVADGPYMALGVERRF